ncbi:hypothetical protein BGZ99_004419 [Dissophora globulifera]|uniref:Endoglucanase n=1 Tax=Dissophora globulifera TaxID=979702 RepID=A0A9P6UV40_9FUNG|nr:hypothetical protein BGZ99_004419 [Dissophora globulifera]
MSGLPSPTLSRMLVSLVLALLACFALLSNNNNIIEAVPRGHDSSSGTVHADEVSGTFYKDAPFDDTYPEPQKLSQKTGGSNTTATTSTQQPYIFTRTWPAMSAATDTADQPDDEEVFPEPEYVRLLDASFLFYEAQRSGKLPEDQRVKWRNDSALRDGNDTTQDLSGGYYDAGDYLKFIFPLTFTLTEICYSGLEFFDGYVLANQTHYLDQMVRWGTDWLIKAHPNNNTLYVQVGIDEVDNAYWGGDTGIPNPRPAYFVSDTHPGTDVMADAAAAFASCSILYRERLNDAEYAATLRQHAESLYSLAETSQPMQEYQKVVPAVACCYASMSFFDDLAWGAAWMFWLTDDATYVAKAGSYMDQESSKNTTMISPISWDDKIGFLYVLMAKLTKGTADGSKWQNLAETFAQFTLDASKPCAFTKGGMYYCYGYSGDDSAVVAANAAFAMALLAHDIETSMSPADMESMAVGSPTRTKIDSYKAFAVKQVRYLLGDNPEKMPYVVGIHPNSPTNPHSSLAAGGRDTDTIDTIPSREAHVLFGALVGGPDKDDRFIDQRSNWRQNEVALDYNAPFTGLMAYQVMSSHDPPPYVQISERGRSSHGPSRTTGGATVSIVALVASLISVAVVAVCVGICHKKRSQIRYWIDVQKERTGRKKPVIQQRLYSTSTFDGLGVVECEKGGQGVSVEGAEFKAAGPPGPAAACSDQMDPAISAAAKLGSGGGSEETLTCGPTAVQPDK